MKYSLGISNFLEEISSLYHSIVFLYFFALITEEGFLLSLCYSWELCIQMISFLFSFASSFCFSELCVRPPQTAILPFCISSIKVVSSACLRLLIFLQAVLTPACDSSSPAFRLMYSAYKLNKQGDSIQP